MITYLEDILFWILTGIIILYSIFIFNNGEIRLFMFLGILLGVAIYMLTISSFIIKINVKIIVTLKNIFTKIFTVVIKPFKFIFSIIRKIFFKPISFFIINIRKSTKNLIKISHKNIKSDKNIVKN